MPLSHALRVVACVAMCLSASAALAQTAIIRGMVTDTAGEALGQAEVTAESAEWRRSEQGRTDNGGRFSFIGLQPGRWLFVVRKRGFESSQGFANVGRTGDSGVIEFELRYDPLNPPPPSTGRLAGIRADDIQSNLDAAHALFDDGDYDAAIAAYQGVLDEIPWLTSVNLQIGHAYREKEDFEAALGAYRAVPAESKAGAEAESAIRDLPSSSTRR